MLRHLPLLLPLLLTTAICGQIPQPKDAPQPVAPEQAALQFQLPAGLRMELVASEPLIREPSGVCWDRQGRLFVCELHGFNLDGQIDIDEANKSGKLDKVVRRFFVPEHIEEAAKAGTYGTLKQLIDTDGDGRMDGAHIWADHLPACFGICPARDGIIVVCAPAIMLLHLLLRTAPLSGQCPAGPARPAPGLRTGSELDPSFPGRTRPVAFTAAAKEG